MRVTSQQTTGMRKVYENKFNFCLKSMWAPPLANEGVIACLKSPVSSSKFGCNDL